MEQLRLPITLVNKGDAQRLLRELNLLEDFFVGAAARTPGSPMTTPKVSRHLDQLAQDNGCNLLDGTHRKALTQALEQVLENAPSVHISFASEPTPKALEPIVRWFRENVHPQVLVHVGYQPAIAAGCVLRTPNKVFDMSMGRHLQKQSELLMRFIAQSINGK